MQSVYALGDPRTNQIRYIGTAKDVYKRYAAHLNHPHTNKVKNAWMDEIKQCGMIPTLTVLESNIEDTQIDVRERFWIQHYLALKMPLTNVQNINDPEEPPIGKLSLRLRVKEVAMSKGISQGRLQRLADMDMNTIRKIYRNPFVIITTETLDKLAKAIECDPRELIEPINKE